MNLIALVAYFFGFWICMASMFYFMTVHTYLDVVKKPWHVRYYIFCLFYWPKFMYDIRKDKKI